MAELKGVAEMFSGQSVFVTGGSGFLGKVLVEKLLRSCPDIGTVFLLLRPKRGRPVQDRLQDILNTPLFAPLLGRSPEVAGKLCAVAGNCAELRLGLSPEDEARLQEEVAFVFHLGATVRFDACLRYAVLLNVRGTREVLELAVRMPRLKAVHHVSTGSVYPKLQELDEIMYYTGHDWRTIIRVAEVTDAGTMNAFSQKIIDWIPLTYCYTKCLSENVIEAYQNQIPVCISRPCLITPTLQDPFPGWADTASGTLPIYYAAGKGLVRSVHADPNILAPVTFVDWAVRGILLSTWATAMDLRLGFETDHLNIVHMSYTGNQLNVGEDIEASLASSHTFTNLERYPRCKVYTSTFLYWLNLIISEVAYALLCDTFCFIFRRKPSARFLIVRRLTFLRQVLSYFLCHQIGTKMDALTRIEKFLPKKDFSAFTSSLNVEDSLKCDYPTYFRDTLLKGLARYVYKEDVDSKKKNRLQILFLIEMAQYFVFGVIMIWSFLRWTETGRNLIQVIM